MIQIKPNVIFQKDKVRIHHLMLEVMGYIATLYKELENKDLTITSCIDGQHMEDSRHYIGQALDFRTKTLREPFRTCDRIKEEIEMKYPNKFKVLYENHGTANAHLHVQTRHIEPADEIIES